MFRISREFILREPGAFFCPAHNFVVRAVELTGAGGGGYLRHSFATHHKGSYEGVGTPPLRFHVRCSSVRQLVAGFAPWAVGVGGNFPKASGVKSNHLLTTSIPTRRAQTAFTSPSKYTPAGVTTLVYGYCCRNFTTTVLLRSNGIGLLVLAHTRITTVGRRQQYICIATAFCVCRRTRRLFYSELPHETAVRVL